MEDCDNEKAIGFNPVQPVSATSFLSFGDSSRYSATPIGLLTSRRVYSITVLFFPLQTMSPIVGESCGILTRLSTAWSYRVHREIFDALAGPEVEHREIDAYAA
jgi:hypothetical protein